MSRRRLTTEEIAAQLPEGWTAHDTWLERTLTFPTYRAGLDLALKIAEHAEAVDHHPDLLLGYRLLTVRYTTHDRGGVTRHDVAGAAFVNGLLGVAG